MIASRTSFNELSDDLNKFLTLWYHSLHKSIQPKTNSISQMIKYPLVDIGNLVSVHLPSMFIILNTTYHHGES